MEQKGQLWPQPLEGVPNWSPIPNYPPFPYNTESRELMKNQYNILSLHKVSSFIQYRKSGITKCLEKLTKSTKGHNRTLTDFITGDHLAAQE
jgi:hypothetical protein